MADATIVDEVYEPLEKNLGAPPCEDVWPPISLRPHILRFQLVKPFTST